MSEYADRFKYFHTPAFFSFRPTAPFAYPAPMGLLYRFVYLVPKHKSPIFLSLIAIVFTAATLLVIRAALREGLGLRPALLFYGLSAALSYPFLFEAKQGNLEFFIWMLIVSGIWLLLRGKGYGAAACFGIAGSMKIFPLVYLGLHLAQRRWKQFFFGLALIVPITLLSLWLIVPDIHYTWQHLQANQAYAQEKIVLHIMYREIGFDHSLFSPIKRLWLIAGFATPVASVLRFYLLFVATLGVAIYFLRIRKSPFANQVLCLAVCSILFPPVSYDYTLLHLYAPLVLIAFAVIRYARSGQSSPKGTTLLLVLLALAAAPLSQLIGHGVRYGGQVRAVVLLALLVAGLVYPVASSPEKEPVPTIA